MGNIITIDGPAGAGKSTVGRIFASKIGYQFLDTGIIYRAGTAYIAHHAISLKDIPKLEEIFSQIELTFHPQEPVSVTVCQEEVNDLLHTDQTNTLGPEVAAIIQIREQVKQIQRKLAQTMDLVVAGRDIGSEIFPNAKLKFFITALAEQRAKRRFDQLKSSHPNTTYQKVLESTKTRDLKDATRKASPMRIPENAIIIDTTFMEVEEVVAKMMEIFKTIY